MFTKKTVFHICSILLMVTFLLMGILPIQADSLASPLDSSGDFVWAKSMGDVSDDQGIGIAVDSSSNVYTTGLFQGTVDFNPGSGTSNLTSAGDWDTFVSKLDKNGNFAWARSMGGTGQDIGNGIAGFGERDSGDSASRQTSLLQDLPAS